MTFRELAIFGAYALTCFGFAMTMNASHLLPHKRVMLVAFFALGVMGATIKLNYSQHRNGREP